jgi:hypothetical protein
MQSESRKPNRRGKGRKKRIKEQEALRKSMQECNSERELAR